MSITETVSGPCQDCGAPTEREKLHGRFAERVNAMPFTCEPCQRRHRDQDDLEQAQTRERAEQAAHYQRVKYSGLPAALLTVDLDELDQAGCADAIASARFWALKGGGLMLTGKFGTGKTTIAAGALRLLLESKQGHWTSAPLLMAHLGSGFDSQQRQRAMAVLQRTSAFVLDDLDKTRPTEYGAEQIFLAIDGAVTSNRPLLVTTNLGLGQLAAKWPEPFGEAIASRLAGYCTVVETTGDDRRLG